MKFQVFSTDSIFCHVHLQREKREIRNKGKEQLSVMRLLWDKGNNSNETQEILLGSAPVSTATQPCTDRLSSV